MGAGKRNYERPSILRVMLMEEKETEVASEKTVNTTGAKENMSELLSEDGKAGAGSDSIYKLESNIDDCTGENLGYVLEQLMDAGARDVNYTPIFMKKNRPAWQLNVICKQGDIKSMEEIIFRETTTIGIRRQKMERTILNRETKTVQTAYGKAVVKVCSMDGMVRYYPEYKSVTEICRIHGLSYQEVYQTVLLACKK